MKKPKFCFLCLFFPSELQNTYYFARPLNTHHLSYLQGRSWNVGNFSFCVVCRCGKWHLMSGLVTWRPSNPLSNDEHSVRCLLFISTSSPPGPTLSPSKLPDQTLLASSQSGEHTTVTWKYKFGLTGWQPAVRANVQSFVSWTTTSRWQARQQAVFFFHQAVPGLPQQAAVIYLTGDFFSPCSTVGQQVGCWEPVCMGFHRNVLLFTHSYVLSHNIFLVLTTSLMK